jgi:hypothetical protein
MGRYFVILEVAGKRLLREFPQKTRLDSRIKSFSVLSRRYWEGDGLSALTAW